MHGYDVSQIVATKPRHHGKVRGIVFDPRDVFDLLRDTYSNIPIPKDAKFEAIDIQRKRTDSYIGFYFSTPSAKRIIVTPTNVNFDPTGAHCVAVKPPQLLAIFKSYANGAIPSDAEATGFSINTRMTFVMIEASSWKFPASLADKIPLIHIRYEEGELFTLDDAKQKASKDTII